MELAIEEDWRTVFLHLDAAAVGQVDRLRKCCIEILKTKRGSEGSGYFI